jgi:hypothetical protein
MTVSVPTSDVSASSVETSTSKHNPKTKIKM